MKYIKKFESLEKDKFWIIPTDQPYLEFAFKKIGMLPKDVNYWVGTWKNSVDEILMHKMPFGWAWTGLNATDDNGVPYLNNPDFENMGRVYIEDHEVDAEKYNI